MDNLFGWSNATWLWLDQAGIVSADLMMSITVIGTIVGYLNRERLRRWFTPNRFPSVGGDIEGRHWNGIVFTVSKKEVPLWVIDQLNPLYIGLVATPQSMAAAEEVMKIARGKRINVLPPRQLDNPDNPAECMEQTRQLLANMHKQSCAPCAVDSTGGKTPMSLGAFMAAEEMRADTLYVSVGYDAQLRSLDIRSASIQCISMPN